jgi:hypothetical protein
MGVKRSKRDPKIGIKKIGHKVHICGIFPFSSTAYTTGQEFSLYCPILSVGEVTIRVLFHSGLSLYKAPPQ